MPIKDGKYKNPNWVNGGPPAIDADELNAISSTLESLDAAGGTGGDGKRYARIVIGTSTNGWTAADCDYLCDGVDDQEEFNQAISYIKSLPNYATHNNFDTIIILSGKYNLTSPISALHSINLIGTGGATLIRETATGEEPYNNMITISFGSIVNINYEIGTSFEQVPTPTSFEILLSGGASVKQCNFNGYRGYNGGSCIGILSGDLAGSHVYNNYFFGWGNDNFDIVVLDAKFFDIYNNNLSSGVSVKQSSQISLDDSFRICQNSTGTISGLITIDGKCGGVISGNQCSRIQILNTKNSKIYAGNVITSNILASGASGRDLITLGENTRFNIVSMNCLQFDNKVGNIQDNGNNNLVINNIAGN